MYAAIVILIIAIIIAIVALNKKPPAAEAGKATSPEVLDGRKIRKIYGTFWVDDSMMLAWKAVGTEPIKAKSK